MSTSGLLGVLSRVVDRWGTHCTRSVAKVGMAGDLGDGAGALCADVGCVRPGVVTLVVADDVPARGV